MSTTDITGDDMFMSLTGFDEIAIATYFGAKPNDLKDDVTALGRALIFVHKRRTEGGAMPDKEAFQAAQELSIGAALEYFADNEAADDAGKEPSA